jgi:hypothetical protein
MKYKNLYLWYFHLLHSNKIESAEKNLAEVEEKLRNLKINHDENQGNNGYVVKPPWATNFTSVKENFSMFEYQNLKNYHQSSGSYGRHFLPNTHRK